MISGSATRTVHATQNPFPQRRAPPPPPLYSTTSFTAIAKKQLTRTNTRRKERLPAQPCRAMVNVDVSPSVILGVGLIGSGVSLWQIRQTKPWISKDYDVVISCISLLVGGILIFQGWRLDPLLLFGQLMTTGAALSFAVEALRLRNEVYEQDEAKALRDAVGSTKVYRTDGNKLMIGDSPLQTRQDEQDDEQDMDFEYYYYDDDNDDDDISYTTTSYYDELPGDTKSSYGFESIGRTESDGGRASRGTGTGLGTTRPRKISLSSSSSSNNDVDDDSFLF